MLKKIRKKDEDYYEVVDTVIPIIEREEETYNLDEKDIEILPEGSIKYELNLIEFPIFSKDKKVKEHTSRKYIFSEKNNEYLEVIPSSNQNHITKKILQEFDEQIFYGLMRIYEETGNRQIISNYPELLKISGIEYKGENNIRAKDSLERMKGCSIVFNSCFFMKDEGQSIRRTKEVNLLQSLDIIKITDKESYLYKSEFEKHGNLKEIFVATLNEDIVKNLDNKLHKYFKIEDLTEIKNATARKIFVMLTKWKHWQKENPMRRTTKFLASRIPLSWKKTNIPKTIISIEKACKELKDLNKIKDYKLNKNKKLEESTIDFYFDGANNILEKINSKIGTEETGHEKLEIIDVKEEHRKIEEAEIYKELEELEKFKDMEEVKYFEDVEEEKENKLEEKNIKEYSKEVLKLFEILPLEEQVESSKEKLENLLKDHTFKYIESDIKYAKKSKVKNYWGYLLKSCENGHYSKDEIEKAKIPAEDKNIKLKKTKEMIEKIEEDKLKIKEQNKLREKALEFYENLNENIKEKIKEKAKELYIQEGEIKDFNLVKKIYQTTLEKLYIHRIIRNTFQDLIGD